MKVLRKDLFYCGELAGDRGRQNGKMKVMKVE